MKVEPILSFFVVLVGVWGNACHSNMIASDRVVLFSFLFTVLIQSHFPCATDIIHVRTISVSTNANSMRSTKKTFASFS